MLMVFDVGNTNIGIGLFDNKNLLLSSQITTKKNCTEDLYAIKIKNIIELYDYNINKINASIISSVVPSVTSLIFQAVKKLCSVESLIIGPGVKNGLNIKIDNPAQLGSDFVITAVATIKKYSLPATIFDFGTATKVSILDKNANFLGCSITAGLNISMEALNKKTANLPEIDLGIPKSVIGKNSIESMKSGLIFGNVAFVEYMIEKIEEELACDIATVILTGGLSIYMKDLVKKKFIYSKNLHLEGLRLIYEKNKFS